MNEMKKNEKLHSVDFKQPTYSSDVLRQATCTLQQSHQTFFGVPFTPVGYIAITWRYHQSGDKTTDHLSLEVEPKYFQNLAHRLLNILYRHLFFFFLVPFSHFYVLRRLLCTAYSNDNKTEKGGDVRRSRTKKRCYQDYYIIIDWFLLRQIRTDDVTRMSVAR